MRILICSHVFAPSVGGTETVGRLLAEEFVSQGHEVRVLTQSNGASAHRFEVYRRPSVSRMLRLIRWADVVFHNNISLKAAWPLGLLHKPWVITHHTWLDGTRPPDRLKRWLLSFASNIAISPAIAQGLPVPSRVIPDPYEASVFFSRRDPAKTRDVIFVGRLVSDKGCDLLAEAAQNLWKEGLEFSFTIVGDGPERARLEAQLQGRADFTGQLEPGRLAQVMNQHRLAVVPSRWNEPFGVVALEAIACGCAVLGSSGGGLPEAIGKCGRTFRNGDLADLTKALREMLAADLTSFTCHAEEHLQRHHPSRIAREYLEVFRTACGSG